MTNVIQKQGFLQKQGRKMFKTWQKRYFKLIDRDLYYLKQQNEPLNKKISLTQVDFVAPAPECKKSFAFKINVPGVNVIYLAADSLEDANSWIEIIEKWRTTVEDDSETIKLDDFNMTEIEKTFQGTIELAEKIRTKQKYIVKRYKKSRFSSIVLESMEQKQKEFLQSMNPFVTSLRYIISDDTYVCLFYDYLPNGCLFGRLREEGKFPESRAAFYAAQLLLALSYFHQHKVKHGHLKPSSLLINEFGYIKVTLPGFTIDKERKPQEEEIEYQPQEVISGGNPTMASDFYSFGILLYEMICGMPPFYDPSSIEYMKKMIKEKPVRFPYHVSKEAKSLIEKLTEKDPNKRLTDVETIKSDPFFRNIVWNNVSTKQVQVEWIPTPSDKVYQTMKDLEKEEQ